MQTHEELKAIQEASQRQALPEHKRVFSVYEKIRRRVHNLPDPTQPPLGYDEHKAFDRVFPYIRLPRLHPPNHGDTVIFNASELPANQLILRDNLQVLRTLPSECIDPIYIDPPFFSGRTYNVISGDTNELRTFYDIWEGGLTPTSSGSKPGSRKSRLVLKKTGSNYVHCDWHASHYIKCEMDRIFGYDNFRNEIVWAYRGGGVPEKDFSRKRDIILRHSESDSYYFDVDSVRVSYSQDSAERLRYVARSFRRSGTYDTYRPHEKGKHPEDWWDIQPLVPSEKR